MKCGFYLKRALIIDELPNRLLSRATRLAGGCIAAAAAVVSAASSAGELPRAKPHHAHNYSED